MAVVIKLASIGTWLIPAAVFLFSGITKMVWPKGVPPSGLEWISSYASYPLALQILGSIEVLLALILLIPKTRRISRVVLLGMLISFSLVIAFHSHDFNFIQNCGCFGEIQRALPQVLLTSYGFALVRNAILCWILLVGFFFDQPRLCFSKNNFAWISSFASIVLFSTFLIGESNLRHDCQRLMAALATSQNTSGMLGRQLPDLSLVDMDGSVRTADLAFRGDDRIIFFSSSCTNCMDMAGDWKEFDRRLSEQASRLVLISADDPKLTNEFLESSGCTEIECFSMRRRSDWMQLGILNVPQLMMLDSNSRITVNESYGQVSSFSRSLSLCASRVHEFDHNVWQRIAKTIFGQGNLVASPTLSSNGVTTATFSSVHNSEQYIIIAAGANTIAHYVELAVGMDNSGLLYGIVPLSAGSYVRAVDPNLRLLDSLEGLVLEQAIDHADKMASEKTMLAPIWRSVESALSTIRNDQKQI